MSPKVMQGTEFSYPERQYLELRLLGNWRLRRIARKMGRNHSILSREVRRNSVRGRYRAKEAQEMAVTRRSRRMTRKKLDHDDVLAGWVSERIRSGWSPEKIAGKTRSSLPPPRLHGSTVSHETIYQWLYAGGGRFGGLTDCLWTRRKRRYARKGRKPKIAVITGKIPVSERPDDMLPGHMESDSMIWSSSKGLLSAQICRVTKVCRLRWCEARTGDETAHALRRTVETLPHGFVRTLSFDNGSENARHGDITEEYGIPTYFCAPHSPWQKPQIENLNRTIRHWYPRKTKAQDLADLDWKRIEDRLNSLPRASLNYLTPNEALIQYRAGGALRS
jgi:IS30 family transposase